MDSTLQNIEYKELTLKIFQKKGLAPAGRNCATAILRIELWAMYAHMSPLSAFYILGQGYASHVLRILLWKAVEKLSGETSRKPAAAKAVSIFVAVTARLKPRPFKTKAETEFFSNL